MAKTAKKLNHDPVKGLVQNTYLFKDLDEAWLLNYLNPDDLKLEKLFSNRPVFTAFLPDEYQNGLYVILEQGLVISRSTPLDRVVSITYVGGCFGMLDLPFSYGLACKTFPMLVEAYKTTHVLKISLETLQQLYEHSEIIRERYRMLFELYFKFQYHLLNCSTYPPQSVATLLRALIYQERGLGNQPEDNKIYSFDLPVDLIARACQLNQRTVEQVLKGMQQEKLIELSKDKESSEDLIQILDPEGLKAVYSATRDKVSWWPLK